jgi:hypothetical protein
MVTKALARNAERAPEKPADEPDFADRFSC